MAFKRATNDNIFWFTHLPTGRLTLFIANPLILFLTTYIFCFVSRQMDERFTINMSTTCPAVDELRHSALFKITRNRKYQLTSIPLESDAFNSNTPFE